MDPPPLQASYAQLSQQIQLYIKASDLDIISTQVRKVLDQVMAHISVKIKKNVEEIEEMRRFMQQSYESLKIDQKDWKMAMFKSLQAQIKKKIEVDYEMTPAKIKDIILLELKGEAQKPNEEQKWFEKLYNTKLKEMEQAHELLLRARKAEYEANYENAFDFYNQAKEKGSILAGHALGAYHQNGIQVEKDNQKAITFYTQAASNYSTSSLNALGMIYEQGIGVEADKPRGIFYCKLAAEMGQPRAWARLAELYKDVDEEKAKLYKQTMKDSLKMPIN